MDWISKLTEIQQKGTVLPVPFFENAQFLENIGDSEIVRLIDDKGLDL